MNKPFVCPLCGAEVQLRSINRGTYFQWIYVAQHLHNKHAIDFCPCGAEANLASHLGGLGVDAVVHLQFWCFGEKP